MRWRGSANVVWMVRTQCHHITVVLHIAGARPFPYLHVGRYTCSAVVVLPARLGVAATALLTKLGSAGLLAKVSVVLIDTDCTTPAQSSRHANAALFRRLGVTPLVIKVSVLLGGCVRT